MEIAIISGGDWPQFQAQLVGHLPEDMPWARPHPLPTSSAKRYRCEGGKWTMVHAGLLAQPARATGPLETNAWGKIRGSQMTVSRLGQRAPLDAKHGLDPDFVKRKRAQAALLPLLPEYAMSIGGLASVDVTATGTDKGTRLAKLVSALVLTTDATMFVGCALFPGGNDY